LVRSFHFFEIWCFSMFCVKLCGFSWISTAGGVEALVLQGGPGHPAHVQRMPHMRFARTACMCTYASEQATSMHVRMHACLWRRPPPTRRKLKQTCPLLSAFARLPLCLLVSGASQWARHQSRAAGW
jgi:hypothetical protein